MAAATLMRDLDGHRPEWAETTVVIVARDDAGWCVQRRDSGTVTYCHTRAEAVRQARALALRHEPSELVIFHPDGQVADHCRFGTR
jgi:hypothetical protein